ncbi:methylenetetrahydrofolate reductase [Marinobacterium arenosum]|uniref:methylenetetrahydrofolate reductase n=1 Tax=Marinobacterium arenosum TaxID=2862496 RepID=UPI001C9794BF|nr:methylenetetrahydrofolate reductase [Marinobacterium arenosum]MBY4678060.1 methylenetetrahydrofolate reductase [Marinobacterium arenosum]
MKLFKEPWGQSAVDETAAVVRRLARTASVEVTTGRILGSQTPPVAQLLPAGTAVYLPSLPQTRFDDILAACRQLLADGLQPVPHLAARRLSSRAELRERLSRLHATGARQLMLIAGDVERPAGPFRDTLDLLQCGLLAEQGFHQLGIAGHPDGHPFVNEKALMQALETKRDYARSTGARLWVVTQFAFDATSFTDWLARFDDSTQPLPVYCGLPGPTRIRTLLAYAAHCGVGVSARLLRRTPGAARLLSCWKPDGVVEALAQHYLTHPGTQLAGMHLFTFGGLESAAHWLHRLRDEPQRKSS